LPKAARTVLDPLRLEGRPLSTGQVAELAGVARPTASRHLQTLRNLELVAWVGPVSVGGLVRADTIRHTQKNVPSAPLEADGTFDRVRCRSCGDDQTVTDRRG
jgi:hypothetical protein